MLRSLFFFFLLSVSFSQTICNIEDYGAKGNNRTVNTRHIQRAINSCDGIYIPEGIFLTGKLHLKSNFSVEISENGVLQGAPFRIYDSLIHAKGVNGLYFSGGGKIDSGVSKNRIYKVIEFLDCTNIRFQNFSVYQHNHDWCFLCENCSYLELDKFQLHGFFGRDGLDLVGCKHVAIHDSLLLGSDDALALKANTTIDSRRGQSYNSYNISVWNCEIASKDDNALQFGSETPGNFTGIFFRDIRISSAGKAGIGITSNDGGYISHVYYENIEMHNVATPFWIKITNRTLPIGMIHDIYIKNVTAAKVYGITSERNMTSTLDGFDAEHRVGPRIYFEDISITYVGGGSLCAVDIQPPNPDTDYRPRYLGPRPSYGFYIRHANEIQLTNVNVSFEDTDLRPPFYFDTVSNIILRNVEGELASGTLSNNCQIVVNETTGLVLESSSLTACEYADISPCPHQVYYYSPYDY